MIVGKVVGSVISTRKVKNLIGNKFMVIEPLSSMAKSTKKILAVDNIGAGVGELVIVALGSAARVGNHEDTPIDAAIIGIVDEKIGLAGAQLED